MVDAPVTTTYAHDGDVEQPGYSDLVVQEPTVFRVHTRAYVDPVVFAAEMKRIFEKTWVYVGHTSELPNPGDYKTSHIGLQPVIVSRGDDGTIHVLLNRCAHRGAVVCRDSRGSANFFRCPYHGWVYGRDGKLTGVSMRGGESGYGPGFQQPEGLFTVPRVDTYRGLIFASLEPDVPDLLEHLGRAQGVIDNKLDLSPQGEISLVSDPYVSTFHGNWKFAAENIVDGYHFTFVHSAFIKLMSEFGHTTGDFGAHQGKNQSEERKLRALGVAVGCPQGHGYSTKPNYTQEELVKSRFSDFYEELRGQHGDRMPHIVGNNSASVFPNLGFIHHQVRVWRPISPGVTEVTIYPYELVGAPEEFNSGWLRSQERFYGPAGHGAPDDTEIFALNQQGLEASALEWLILERGLESEQRQEDGAFTGMPAGETPQRALWRRWKELMS